MYKLTVIGDVHGRNIWKKMIEKSSPNEVVFIGDYFDSWDVPGLEQLYNFNEICLFKEGAEIPVTLLIGNHDHHYFPEIGDTGTSGYQLKMRTAFEGALIEKRHLLQMAYQYTEYLFTHAGVSEEFLKEQGHQGEPIEEFLNDLWIHRPQAFQFNGTDPYGDNTYQTPIWIRPKSLMRASQELKKKYIQIVGHTAVKSIDIKGKATGGRYYFIDTQDRIDDFLVLEDGKPTLHTL